MQKVGLNLFRASLASATTAAYLMTMSMKVLCKVKGEAAFENAAGFSSFVASGGDEDGEAFSEGRPRV